MDVVLAGIIGSKMFRDQRALHVYICYLEKLGLIQDAGITHRRREAKPAWDPTVDKSTWCKLLLAAASI